MNLLVTGSRDYPRLDFVERVIAGFVTNPTRTRDVETLYVGDARGVDTVAAYAFEKWAGRKATVFKAEWDKHPGRSAGYVRNAEMVKAFSELDDFGIVLAFWDGKSAGTLHTMKEAKKRNLTVLIPDSFIDINLKEKRGSLALRIWTGEESLV